MLCAVGDVARVTHDAEHTTEAAIASCISPVRLLSSSSYCPEHLVLSVVVDREPFVPHAASDGAAGVERNRWSFSAAGAFLCTEAHAADDVRHGMDFAESSNLPFDRPALEI
jgi:hypothetical protein